MQDWLSLSSYASLGLIHDLNPSASGGIEPLENQGRREDNDIPMASTSQPEGSASSSTIPKGFGKIIRDESGNILRIEMAEGEEEEPQDEKTQDMEMQEPDVPGAVFGQWVTDLGGGEKSNLETGDSDVVKGEHVCRVVLCVFRSAAFLVTISVWGCTSSIWSSCLHY